MRRGPVVLSVWAAAVAGASASRRVRQIERVSISGTPVALHLVDDRQSASPHRFNFGGGFMEWNIIGMNFLYAVLGVVLMFISYRVIDKLTPEVNFADELQKGNVAVAIVIAAIFLAIAIIVGGSLN
jgi:cytochrome b subunit of formate dehydrogenase